LFSNFIKLYFPFIKSISPSVDTKTNSHCDWQQVQTQGAWLKGDKGRERGRGKCAAKWRVVIVVVVPIPTPVVVVFVVIAAWALLRCQLWVQIMHRVVVVVVAGSLAVVYIKGV